MERLQLKSVLATSAPGVSCAVRLPTQAKRRVEEKSNFGSMLTQVLSPPHSAMYQPSPPNQRPDWTAFSDLLFGLPGFPPWIGRNRPSAVQRYQNLRD